MRPRLRGLVVALAAIAISVGGTALAAAAPPARVCRTITVVTRAHGGTTRRREHLCETAAIGLTRTSVTAIGGSITVHFAATQATECTLAVTPAVWRGRNPAPVHCRGKYTFHVPPANPGRTWKFTFLARNRYREVAGAVTSLVATPAPTNLPVLPGYSSNWSGYAVEGGGMNAVAGTFTVPTLSPPSGGVADASEWVGIDGVSNGSLIQAGVHEEASRGVVRWGSGRGGRSCPPRRRPSGRWSSMPATRSRSTSTGCRAASGRSASSDVTTSQAFAIRQTYTGPSTSAEWIVEAPSIGSSTATLGNFSTTPVIYSGLSIDGVAMSLDQPVHGRQRGRDDLQSVRTRWQQLPGRLRQHRSRIVSAHARGIRRQCIAMTLTTITPTPTASSTAAATALPMSERPETRPAANPNANSSVASSQIDAHTATSAL